MSGGSPTGPECDPPMKFGGWALMDREEDGKRTCRALWRCPGRHLWWHWADQPDAPLELCPIPQAFGR
ncbi:dehydrogenase [Streptomyces venezuelae]|nr:dehydrogenase [Streptomyces venezuelae]